MRKALADELKLAGIYAEGGRPVLTGKLDALGFSSVTGRWNLGVTLTEIVPTPGSGTEPGVAFTVDSGGRVSP